MAQKPSETFIRPAELWHDLGLKAGQTVVHLGSGPGFFLIPAAKLVGKTGMVIGVDIFASLLQDLEANVKREDSQAVIKTIRADIESPEGSTLPADSADWVLVANILHQSDPLKVIIEARRLVKADGFIAIIAWLRSATPLGPPLEDRVSKQDILKITEQLHLRLDREFSPSPYHFGLLLTRLSS
ncbi:methyltransferase domain-containing protein [Patescibacteria group bacterium]|nr:methyltransferase domain-containing protein [Patescibacteria group bacterium]